MRQTSQEENKKPRGRFAPKSAFDRELAQALKEIEQGKTFGPFNSAKDLIRSLNREAKKLKKKPS